MFQNSKPVHSSKSAVKLNAVMHALRDILHDRLIIHCPQHLIPKVDLSMTIVELQLLRAVAFINGLCNNT